MSNSRSRHASSSTHYAFPLDDGRPRGGPQASWSRRLGESSSRPRSASTGTWALRASDHNRAPSWGDGQVGGSAPHRSSPGSSREIPAPQSHNPLTYDYDEYDDVLNSPTPSSPSAKSLSLAPSEDHIQLARAAALARSISKQRAAGRDPAQPLSPPTATSAVNAKPLGSWWSFLPGAAADGSRVSVADGERRVDESHRRRSGADVGPSTSLPARRPQAQTFGPRAHPAGAAVLAPIDGLLTVTDRWHQQAQIGVRDGRRDVGEQLHGVGWRTHRAGLRGARAHGDSPGCARSPDKAPVPVRGFLPAQPRAQGRPYLGALNPDVRDRPRRADEFEPIRYDTLIKRPRVVLDFARSPAPQASVETKGTDSSPPPDGAAPRALRRVSLATNPSGDGAGVLHTEEGLSTESERRALYQFDQLMLARGLVGIFRLRTLQKVVDEERYWQFKCTLLVMEPYPSDTCVYRGARVTRATRIEARAAAAQDALSALSSNPTVARRASLSPLALVPETPCPPYRRDPLSPDPALSNHAPGPSPLSRIPPSLIVTHDDEPDGPSETCSVGTHTPSHGSLSSCYELVYDDPDLLLLDQSQMPRSVSANAASRLEWPGDPPPDSDRGDARHRPVSR